jgi:hypothetical protein
MLKALLPFVKKEPKWESGQGFYPSPLTSLLALMGKSGSGEQEGELIQELLNAGLRVEQTYVSSGTNAKKVPTMYTDALGEAEIFKNISPKTIQLQNFCENPPNRPKIGKALSVRLHVLDMKNQILKETK